RENALVKKNPSAAATASKPMDAAASGRHSSALCCATYRSMPASEIASKAKPLHKNRRMMRPLTDVAVSILVPDAASNACVKRPTAAPQSAEVVSVAPSRSALAPHQRSLSHLDLRNHVAADPCRGRDSVLRTIPPLVPPSRRLGLRSRKRITRRLGWLGILLPRAQLAEGCANHRRFGALPLRLLRAPGIARRWCLHRGCRGKHRFRQAARRIGWKRRAGPQPPYRPAR